MHIIISRPYDDKSIVEAYLVEHTEFESKGPLDFESEWEKALEQAKKKNPEEWSVDDVFNLMEKEGWQIFKPTHIGNITY